MHLQLRHVDTHELSKRVVKKKKKKKNMMMMVLKMLVRITNMMLKRCQEECVCSGRSRERAERDWWPLEI